MIDIDNAIERIEKHLDDDEWFQIEVIDRSSRLTFSVSIWIPENGNDGECPAITKNGDTLQDVVGGLLDDLSAWRQKRRWISDGLCGDCGGKIADDGLCADQDCRGALPF